jgi:undecaprenyl-diphosphatase
MGIAIAPAPATPFTQPLDDAWRALIGVGADSGAYPRFVTMFFQQFGELPGVVVTVLLIPLALVLVGRWRSAVFFVSVIALGPGLLSQVMKNLVDRPRPIADATLGLSGPLFSVDHGSFPSGHSISAAAFAVSVAALIPPSRTLVRRAWWVLGLLLMLGMAWQRTLVNAHWLSDTLVGLVTRVGAALLMWWAFWPWLHREYGRPISSRRRQRAREPGAAAPSPTLSTK